MVAGEGSRAAWEQVSVWWRLSQALHAQRERLAAVRDAVARAWPPEHSEASRRFVEVLDGLVASLQQAGYAAGSTALGLAGIVRVLAEAKAQIEPLYERWRAVGGDAVPAWWDGAEEELNEQARGVMARAEVEVADYAELLKPMPKYQLGPVDTPTEVLGSDQSHTARASDTAPRSDRLPLPLVPHNPPEPLPGTDPLLPGGPVLAGGPPVPASPGLVDSGQAMVPPGPGGANRSDSWLVTTPRGPVLMPGGVIRPPTTASTRVPGAIAPPGASGPPPMGGASARGALAAPGGARGVPGLVTPGGIAPTGMSGHHGSGHGGAGRVRTSVPTPMSGGYRTSDGHLVKISGLNARHTGAPGRPTADPNDPWAVDTGVPAVITPDPPRRHDPGPGVIGIDR
jgi:hypothetical protein